MAGWRILTFNCSGHRIPLATPAFGEGAAGQKQTKQTKGITWCQHILQRKEISQEKNIRGWLALKL